jgi:hypothetical protein
MVDKLESFLGILPPHIRRRLLIWKFLGSRHVKGHPSCSCLTILPMPRPEIAF